ncbi:DUF3499 domain-containing protein [Tessaracoccus lubricantis]|uniref:DUF3499 domain-containing protein n=1 Tax=Tessaracoccus lubricantis TaxID=545543 RepID=A0ABP9FC78_9ACTN
MATLTYVYADSTAVLGPLSLTPEPGIYDLCLRHAERTSPPNGWELIRIPLNGAAPAPVPEASDDLMALADAVRAIGLRHDDPPPRVPDPAVPAVVLGPEHGRGGHLRLVPTGE